MAIIKLRRARNSLLDVSRLPSEILGDIFRRNVALEGLVGGLGERSHNFLFVCHHWFSVASCNPEVWSFWGNNLQDWRKRHIRYPTTPLDLVLRQESFDAETLDDSLRNALQDRAARDTIRRIHLFAHDSQLLHSILSSLASSEGPRSSSVQSVVVKDESKDTLIDIPNLFSCRFPRLQHLTLDGCKIPSWNLVIPQTSTLTTLFLNLVYPTPLPTMSRLLSFLGSNPALQEISLLGCAVPDGGGDMSSVPVPLHQLRELKLAGNPLQVFGFLCQLNLPGNMDRFLIHLSGCTLEDIPKTIGPYLRDHLRRRKRSQSGVGLTLSSRQGIIKEFIELRVGDVCGVDFSAPGPVRMEKLVEISICLDTAPSHVAVQQHVLDLVAHAPREEIVYFHVRGTPVVMADVSTKLPCLRALHIEWTFLDLAFPEPTPDTDAEIFPSLQHLTLGILYVPRDEWGPLTAFLARRVSSGNQLDTLVIGALHPPHRDAEEAFRKWVPEFRITDVRELESMSTRY